MPSRIAPAQSLPATIRPMLARLARLPFDSADHIFELKWDGIRALAFVADGRIRLQNRNLDDITERFPELKKLASSVEADRVVLDGELVCFDDEGHPSLERMQRRIRRHEQGRAVRTPAVHFIAFDLLMISGRSMMSEPLVQRKNVLHNILQPTALAQACEFIESDGKDFFQATCDLGLEGIVAKEKAGRYLPGRRSTSWLKVKRIRESEFVVGGYAFGGEHGEIVGSLLLGLYDERQRLAFVGQVDVDLPRAEAKELLRGLQSLHDADSPFRHPPHLLKFIHWCRPELVCRVEYGEFTPDGKLHYPVYLMLRDDKPPIDCRIVDAHGWPSELRHMA